MALIIINIAKFKYNNMIVLFSVIKLSIQLYPK